MKVGRIITVLLLCLVSASFMACNPFDGDGEEASWQPVEVVRGDLTISVSGSGNIEVDNEVKLTFGTGGKIDKIYVKEGDEVSEGDVLAELDTGALELALTQAQAALETAEYNLDKVKNPYSSLEISALELAVTQAELALTQAESALKVAQHNLDKKDALELALTQAELALKVAEHNLEEAKEPYTEEDIDNAQAAVDESEYALEFAQWKLERASLLREKMTYELEIYRTQLNLDIAQQNLDTMLSGPDEDEIAIMEMRVETAKQSLEQAQKGLDEVKIMEMQVEVAKQSLEQAQRFLEHAQKQLDEATVPDEDDMELMEIRVEVAKQSLEQAQKQLDEATMTAPFDGVVAGVYVKEGNIISAPTIIIYLIDLTSMELKAEVDEIDVAEVKRGQRTIIEVDALPTLQIEGEVISISLLARKEAGLVLYEVKVGFDVPEGSGLRVGMSATADIIINERSNVLLVPNRAIKWDSQGNPIVEVMVDEQIEERAVVTGISDGIQTEIVSGLHGGEVVIERRGKTEPEGFLF